ncbi:19541_t:CDS:1, partial [Racocetra persica]
SRCIRFEDHRLSDSDLFCVCCGDNNLDAQHVDWEENCCLERLG